MTRKPSRLELRDNPTPAERRDIEHRIRLLPLMRRDAPGVVDWPGVAGRLADELAAMARRLDDDDATDADRERIARAAVVIRDYREALAAEESDG